MDTVVMKIEGNPENDSMNLSERKKTQPNVGMVKQEAAEADDILLQHEVSTSKPENVSTDEQLESASSNTLDVIKSETVAQDYWLESDQEIPIKEELLHEEFNIKSEDETTQETPVDEKHKLGNKLNKNMKHPSGVKPFKCYVCDLSCRYISSLKRHLRTHTGERPFKCNICDSNFNQKSHLIGHLRTHSGEKPFKCNFCDYRCTHKTTLRRHLRTHTGEKPFKCNVCNKTFSLKKNLNGHMITHSRDKPC